MPRFTEIKAVLPEHVSGVVTLPCDPRVRFMVAVDVTGCDDVASDQRIRKAGVAFQRLVGGNRVLVMPERDGRPMARVFMVEADE